MTEPIIDLRSDTVTQPCEGMKQAMLAAQLGDDVYGEDPTVTALQARMAEMADHESALFFPSGTQSNLVALLSHCQRGDEYIVAQNAHTYKFEGGGAAVLGGIQPQPIEREPNGLLALEKIEAVIKEDDIHFANTRLLALENTTTEGVAVAVDHMVDAAELCRAHKINIHLDGARVFNAAAELGVDVSQITRHFDSVSICLSKGLGAPVGSVLCGSREFMETARRWRKTVGGGMRQCGMLAAAGLFALENNVERLKDDHALATYLFGQLKPFKDIEFACGQANTNMIFFNLARGNVDEFHRFGKQNGVLFNGPNPIRMVTHKDLSKQHIDIAVERLSGFFRGSFSA
ncbi:low-specificity L-threonine aldolase [Candidatus Spongiihabitans sp.]|uniref:low-specificity L-threonine aldolase n=1 Tax=Candidatus Spongiihabitans sp. TaxID=3101308 RepID=UPI003C7D7F3B